MRFYIIFACLIVAACTPSPPASRQVDDWTGFAQVITPEHEILRDRTAIMTARGVMITRDGERRFAILTSLQRLVPNGPVIRSMHSGEIRLDYHKHDRLLTHCADRCRRAEVGAIYLTQTAFEIGSRTGLPLRIQGKRGRYEATVPPTLFAKVLNASQ